MARYINNILIYGADEMIESYSSISDACKMIINKTSSAYESSIKSRCIEYFMKYVSGMSCGMDNPGFFQNYFLRWLPYKICLESDEVIKYMFPAVEEYLKLNDMLTGGRLYSYFKDNISELEDESLRLMRLKHMLIKFNKSFIISKVPVIIDLEKYRDKQRLLSDETVTETMEGEFFVESIFPSDSLILRQKSYISHFVRLFFDKEVIEYVRENDILDIRIVKINNRWRLDEIKGCSISIEMTW